jgi:hypothetical protein
MRLVEGVKMSLKTRAILNVAEGLNLQESDIANIIDGHTVTINNSFMRVIGEGAFTVAIETTELTFINDRSFRDGVLLLTEDDEKQDILEALGFKVEQIDIESAYEKAEKEWLEDNGFKDIDSAEEEGYYFFEEADVYLSNTELTLYYLFANYADPNSYKILWVEKAEKYEASEEFIKEVIKGITEVFLDLENDDSSSIVNFLPQDIIYWEKDEDGFIEKIQKYKEAIRNIFYDFIDYINVVSNYKGNCVWSLDIHTGQFLKKEGKVKVADFLVFH